MRGAVQRRVRNTGVARGGIYEGLGGSIPPAGTPTYDGPAQLPGPRFDALKAWADTIPNWSSITSGRRVTVAGSTHADLQNAINTAAAMTGGDRLVIVPDGFVSTVQITMPDNADSNYDIIIAWSKMVDGTFTTVRGRRIGITTAANGVSSVGPSGMPKLFTAVIGVGQHASPFTFPRSAACTRYKLYGLEIRVDINAVYNNVYALCYALIDFGPRVGTTYGDGSDAPSNMLVSHCVLGGRALSPDNRWRQNNLGRTIFDNGIGVALLDSWDVEHGDQYGGSDRGIWNGVASQGPVYIDNIQTDHGGGIMFMNGGEDMPDTHPPCADVSITHCWLERTQVYNRWNTAAQYKDVDNNVCLWVTKNMFETKTQRRTRFHRNVLTGFWADSQNAIIVIKSNNQEGGGRRDATMDIVFSENILLSGGDGIAVSSRTAVYPGSPYAGLVDGLKRLTVRDNIVTYGLKTTFPGNNGRTSALMLSPNASGTAPFGDPARDHVYDNNLFDYSNEAQFGYPVLFNGLDRSGITALYAVRRNLFLTGTSPTEYYAPSVDSIGAYPGWNNVFDVSTYTPVLDLRFVENAFLKATPWANGSSYDAQQFYRSSKSAIGITDGAQLGDYTVTPGSLAAIGGTGGVRLGPDCASLAAMRITIKSGAFA